MRWFNFWASDPTPEPAIELAAPSSENAEAKRRFESERLELWFGS